MPEFRQDPIVDRWVIIAKKRAQRPVTTIDTSLKEVDDDSYCPFCEGEEQATPKEIYAIRGEGSSPNEPGWSLRIVPNKFPALSSEGDADTKSEGLFRSVAGVGLHEVVIETSVHDISFGDMEEGAVVDIFRAVIKRFRAYRKDKRIASVQFFKTMARRPAPLCLIHIHRSSVCLSSPAWWPKSWPERRSDLLKTVYAPIARSPIMR